MPPKRKRSSVAAATGPENGLPPILHETPIPLPTSTIKTPAPKRQASRRGKIDTNPDHNADIVDGKTSLRASPDADEKGEALEVGKVNSGPKGPARTNGMNENVVDEDSDSPLSDIELPSTPIKKQKTPTRAR
jgi:UV DNA damage endonuclease